jgi:hypothetical protein
MALRAEKASSTRITAAERTQLIEAIAEHTNSRAEAHSDAANWEELRHYIGLIGLAGAIHFPDAKPGQLAHARKMLAHEVVETTAVRGKTKESRALLGYAAELAPSEIDELIAFGDDPTKLSKPYKNALYDLLKIREELITDQLTLKLRKSLHGIQEE